MAISEKETIQKSIVSFLMNTENYYDRCNQSFVHYRSEPLTAVLWQSLPKSEIWTTAQYLKLKNDPRGGGDSSTPLRCAQNDRVEAMVFLIADTVIKQ